MRVIERTIEHPENEGVILEYVNWTKDFAEIKEYVKRKGDTIMGYTQDPACLSIRIEDILYFETVDGNAFAYTADELYKLSGRLYQDEEDVKRSYICRASKTMLVNMDKIESVRTALNGRLYAKMENGEEILVTRKYAKEIEEYFVREADHERV